MRRVLRTPSVRAGRVLRSSKTRLARVGCPGRFAGLLAISLSLPAAWLLSPVALGSSTSEPEAGSGRPASSEVQIVRELVGLRTATSDTFLRSDGSRLARVYPTPVNYRAASGEWVPIDDTLQRAPTGWETAASPTPVTLPSSLASSPVTVGPANRSVGFALEGASTIEGQNAGPSMSYPNAQAGVNVSYSVSSEGVREVLSLASAASPTIYRYKLTYAAGLRPELTSAGGVAFKDTTGKVAYTMAPPTATDASLGAQLPSTAPVHYELSADGSVLSLVLDKSWLEDPRRVFPVQVDPDIYFYEQSDCSIASSSYANSNLCGGPLYVGANTETPKSVARSMLQFNLASIPRDANVLYSRLALWFKADSTTSPIEIEANGLTRNFTQAATWNKYDGTNAWTTPGGDFTATMSGKQTILDSYKNFWVNWGFAPLVQQWIQEPSSNHGVLLKARNEAVSGYDEFLRVNNSEKTDEPSLEIAYATRTGINEGDVVIGDELAAGGDVAVNAANGNLLVTTPDVNYEGEGYETHLTRDYNSQDENLTGSSFGSGWVLNTGNNTLLYPAWWDRSYAFHEPGGGWTRFDPTPPSNSLENQAQLKYVAQPGLNATLVAHEDGTRTVTFNETGTEWLFDKSENGFPQKIVEHAGSGNTLSLGYTESRLTHLSDTHGHELTVTLDPTTHHVTKVQNVTGEHWEYAYNANHQLTSYKDNEGHEAKYGYTSTSGVVNEITDTTGTYVITYDTKGRVTALRKLVNGTVKEVGTEDQVQSYEYKTPESPTCNPATDVKETVVTYKPTGAPETFCFDGADHFTGPKSEEEVEAAESVESPEVPAGTCEPDEQLGTEDCSLEEPAPEPPEELDLKKENYGLADNNWLYGPTKAQEEAGLKHPAINYFGLTPIQELKVKKYRRTIPWNMVSEAEHYIHNEERNIGTLGALARMEDVEKWVTAVKTAGGEPYVSFDMECGYVPKSDKPPNEHTLTEWDTPGKDKVENEADDHKCTEAPTKAEYMKAVEAFVSRPVLNEAPWFTALNEPNNLNKVKSPDETAEVHEKTTWSPTEKVEVGEHKHTGAHLAGEYWRALNYVCRKRKPECYVAAGDFLDDFMSNPRDPRTIGHKYWEEYKNGIGHQLKPYHWAWHAYKDGVETQNPANKHSTSKWWYRYHAFEHAVNGFMKNAKYRPRFFLMEQGVEFFVKEKEPVHAYAEPGVADAIVNAYVKHGRGQLTEQSPYITRFFYYSTRGEPNFDSGLLEAEVLPKGINRQRATNTPRPIYRIYKQVAPG
jgi:YD repeat-containing protein